MSTATRTTASRKAMRVATVFTGAAAAAVLPSAAMAGTATPVRPTDHIEALRPANSSGKVYGSIRRQPQCDFPGATKPQWVHIIGVGAGGSTETCFGFAGLWDVSGGLANEWTINYECGGTNFGALNPLTDSQSFGPGTGYRKEHGFHMNSIDIFAWSSGGKTCPLSP
jgi:hypothetical protein